MATKAYVVWRWMSCRKNQDSEILGVYTNRETAKKALKQFAEKCKEDYDCEKIEEGNDFYNVIDGEIYHVFELSGNMPIITD